MHIRCILDAHPLPNDASFIHSTLSMVISFTALSPNLQATHLEFLPLKSSDFMRDHFEAFLGSFSHAFLTCLPCHICCCKVLNVFDILIDTLIVFDILIDTPRTEVEDPSVLGGVTFALFMSCHVLSLHVLSLHVLSCLVMSCLLMSCLTAEAIAYCGETLFVSVLTLFSFDLISLR